MKLQDGGFATVTQRSFKLLRNFTGTNPAKKPKCQAPAGAFVGVHQH